MKLFERVLPLTVVIVGVIVIASCNTRSLTARERGKDFLAALQQRDFAAARQISGDSTAGILYIIEEMLAAQASTRQELSLPIPGADDPIIFTGQSGSGDGNRDVIELYFTSGTQTFTLRASLINNEWIIDLPRESW